MSDLDVLAVVKSGTSKIDKEIVISYLPAEYLPMPLSISWYGENRIRNMYLNGELFAWHIFYETILLYDAYHFLESLGRPEKYKSCIQDVRSFRAIFDNVASQVTSMPYNSIYEAGIIYSCVRNIAMSASWYLCARPNFSRYSPFDLQLESPCPISREEYILAMKCRMSSQRGDAPPPGVDADFVLKIASVLPAWLDDIETEVKGRMKNG
ncbi:hypothetical protein RUR49_14485 [Pseudoxanthobacter sp. M-2]|uniref:hypothetical protein n=1 Tax=Pseudoxanthobacter sp. M-2 TaxID=3078754 RepID=UPI0038FC9ED9